MINTTPYTHAYTRIHPRPTLALGGFLAIILSTLTSCTSWGPSEQPIPDRPIESRPVGNRSIEHSPAEQPQTSATTASSALIQRADYQAFANQVARDHGFTRTQLDNIFARVQLNPEIIARITKPAEGIDWHRYQKIFIQPERMQAGAEYWQTHRALLEAAETKTGVPPEIIAGIIGVETYYGRYKGNYPVIEALATLGFDYPKRGAFFRKQLAAFLVLARDNNFDLYGVKGSYAGAMGLPQFIPTSYQAYAVDGDGDGQIDLFNNHADVIFSVANYFAEHGWQGDQPIVFRASGSANGAWKNTNPYGQKLTSTVAQLAQQGMNVPAGVRWNESARIFDFKQQRDGQTFIEYWLALNNFYVITRYNHSKLYALAVYQLAEGIKASKRLRP